MSDKQYMYPRNFTSALETVQGLYKYTKICNKNRESGAKMRREYPSDISREQFKPIDPELKKARKTT